MADEANAGAAGGEGSAAGGGAAGGEAAGGAGGASALFSPEFAAGTGAEGAGAGDQAAGGGVGEPSGDGAAAAGFVSQLSANANEGEKSNRDWVAAKGFKDIDGLVAAHRAAEKALHDSGRIKIPGEGASAEDLRAFHTAIGVPDDVAGYSVAPPKDASGAEIALNQDVIGRLAETALATGMPKAAFEATVQAFAKMTIDDHAMAERDAMAKADAVAKGWGPAKAENMAALDRAVNALELTRAEVAGMRNVIGTERFMDRMLALGRGMGESKVFGSDSQAKFGMSVPEAEARKAELLAKPGFAAKAGNKGSPENLEYERVTAVLGEDANRKAREAA